ncbi:MAG TPA: MotA/TolQ/ExbB proton channel family protein [Bryobacteraceae bacterium]|nr:MotA/TolQ/ExbB proton channel family protein [Bryobacteraceae bacterium]
MHSVELACGRAAAVFLARMRRGVRSLATVAAVAPLVGIFGTLIGIVNSFRGVIGNGEDHLWFTMDWLSMGIVPTALGLAVAILAWWCYRYLLARLEDFETEMAAATQVLVSQLRHFRHRDV